jgi:MFS family permease
MIFFLFLFSLYKYCAMHEVAPSKGIAWPQVGSLIAINASLIISWIAYHNYQPILLERFAFSHYESFLGWVKLIVLAIIPPLAGYLADKIGKGNAQHIPLLTAGVSFTAMIFFVVGLMITPNQVLPFGFLLPLMMVLWLIAMNVFYAPALAALDQLVSREQMGIAVAVYALVADLLYGLEPIIIGLVNFFGAAPTFFIGGLLVLGSGLFFQKSFGKVKMDITSVQTRSNFGYVLLVGLCLGLVSGYIINRLGDLVPTGWSVGSVSVDGELWVSKIFILAALLALPAAKWVKGKNQVRLFFQCFTFSMLLLLVVGFLPFSGAIFTSILLSVCLAVLSVTSLPIAFSKLDPAHMAFGMGVFICGLELPDSLMEIFY